MAQSTVFWKQQISTFDLLSNSNITLSHINAKNTRTSLLGHHLLLSPGQAILNWSNNHIPNVPYISSLPFIKTLSLHLLDHNTRLRRENERLNKKLAARRQYTQVFNTQKHYYFYCFCLCFSVSIFYFVFVFVYFFTTNHSVYIMKQ